MSTRTRKDVILWGALGCALVSTAHAEYTLATAAHFNGYVALAVPGALDLYVIRALQQRKDVLAAVLAMVAANVASHLIVAGVLPVEWPVIAAVGAVAPLIVWRVYSLKYRAGAGVWNAPEASTEQVQASDQPRWDAGYHLDGCDGQHAFQGPVNCVDRASAVHSPAPDHVPASWMEDEYPETHPSTPYLKASAVPYLAPVPDLPDEYAAGAVHSESPLTATDWDYLPGAQKYVDDVANPTVRGLKRELRIGQERAERLLTHLGVLL